jgi:NAD+ kinase
LLKSIHLVRKLDAARTSPAIITTIQRIVDTITMCLPDLSRLMEEDVEIVDTPNAQTLIISIGGDGTMLEAMRLSATRGGIAMGINLGRIGFLSDFIMHDSLPKTLREIFEQEKENLSGEVQTIPSHYPLESRMGLQLNYPALKDGRPPIAFNEFTIAEKYSDEMLQYHLKIGEMDAGYHRANSLILATPTGSTAYSLAAGGSLVIPSIDVIQIVPVAAATMTSRSIIVDARSTILVEAMKGNIVLRADGTPVDVQSFKFAISAAVVRAKIIHPPKWNFFEMLTKKLGWQQG